MIGFFSDLIIFTFGMIVLVLWIVGLIAVGIEIKDILTGWKPKEEDQHDQEAF